MKELKTRGEKAFTIFAAIILGILAILILMPFVLIVISSITNENNLIADGYSFFPKAFSLDAYYYMLVQAKTILRAYGVSLLVTVAGTAISVIVTAMIAYPLSRRDFRYRNIISFIVFFTMLFNGGIVPSYIMWTRMFGIKDTLFALIFPNFLVGAFNIFLVRNYYTTNVPPALIESAKIDGAGELKIFFKIMLPLSIPVIATIGIFTGLLYWNDWINGLYYISNPKLYSVQILLVRILDNIQALKSGSASFAIGSAAVQLPGTSIRMALAVIGVLPILILLPFVQKYFIKGVVVGAVKG